jgi:hypothetical protein
MESQASDALAGGILAVWSSMMCLMYLIPMVLAGLSIAGWIVAVVDVVQRAPEDFPNACSGRDDPSERMIWLLIVLLVGVIGAVVYYFIVMKPYPRPKLAPPTAGAPPAGGE